MKGSQHSPKFSVWGAPSPLFSRRRTPTCRILGRGPKRVMLGAFFFVYVLFCSWFVTAGVSHKASNPRKNKVAQSSSKVSFGEIQEIGQTAGLKVGSSCRRRRGTPTFGPTFWPVNFVDSPETYFWAPFGLLDLFGDSGLAAHAGRHNSRAKASLMFFSLGIYSTVQNGYRIVAEPQAATLWTPPSQNSILQHTVLLYLRVVLAKAQQWTCRAKTYSDYL